jgi:hypothetical protein
MNDDMRATQDIGATGAGCKHWWDDLSVRMSIGGVLAMTWLCRVISKKNPRHVIMSPVSRDEQVKAANKYSSVRS